MESLKSVLTHPSEFYILLKLKIAAKQAEKNIPTEPNLRFCYAMLHKVSKSFSFVIQHLGNDLRDAVCIFYLVLRALDTIEDDTSIDIETKIPILLEFHRLIYNPDWHFKCGTKQCKVLMDQFHNVSKAFLELNESYQKVIEDTAMKMGVGMAKFIRNEVDTINDYDEYCHYAAGLVGIGLSKLFHASGKEISHPDPISNSMGLFLQKANIIRDFHEDINEVPKPLIFWPREIWSKYADKFEDLRHKDNSEKALECLNDMVTNALIHIEDCLKYMSDLRDPEIFRFCAIPQIMAIGTLALCYSNIKVFRCVVKMRRGLMAKVIDRTKTMADVYGAFYDFSLLLESKIDSNDPNASTTFSRIEAVQKICWESGTIDRRESYVAIDEPSNGPALVRVALLIVILAILYAYLRANQPS